MVLVNPVGPGLTHCSLCQICSSLPKIVTEVGLTIFLIVIITVCR
jgi:hypothetical protein